eukprot:440287-Prymnesium_polylepis.1
MHSTSLPSMKRCWPICFGLTSRLKKCRLPPNVPATSIGLSVLAEKSTAFCSRGGVWSPEAFARGAGAGRWAS